MKINVVFIVILVALFVTSFISSNDTNGTDQPEGSKTIKFTKQYDLSSWSTLNDGVMGGISTSTITINEDGNANFSGTVSTANNGGFASVRYKTAPIKVTPKQIVTIRLKGDGKGYQFRVKQNSSDFISYIITFPTSGSWEDIKIQLSDLYPSVMGRRLDRANFSADSIKEFSLLITSKRTEAFELLVDSITFDT